MMDILIMDDSNEHRVFFDHKLFVELFEQVCDCHKNENYFIERDSMTAWSIKQLKQLDW